MLHNILMEANKPTTGTVVDSIVSVSGTVPTYLNNVTYTSNNTHLKNISVRNGTHSWLNKRSCNELSLHGATITTAVGIVPTSSDHVMLSFKDCTIKNNLIGGANYDGSIATFSKMNVWYDNLTFDTTSRVVSGCGYVRYGSANTITTANVHVGVISKVAYAYAGGYVYGAGSPYTGTVMQHIDNLNVHIDGAVADRFYLRGNIRNYGKFTANKVTGVMDSGNITNLLAGAQAENNSTSEITECYMIIKGGTIGSVYMGGSNTSGATDRILGTSTLDIEGTPSITNVFMTGMNASCYVDGDSTININTPITIGSINANSGSGAAANIAGDTILNINAPLVLTMGFQYTPTIINFNDPASDIVILYAGTTMNVNPKGKSTINIIDPASRTNSRLIHLSAHPHSSITYWIDNFEYKLDGVSYTPELISSSDTENRYSLGVYTLICTTSTISIE